MSNPGEESPVQDLKNAERLKFFTDAVVAIALTLLILPLLESVSDAARQHRTAAEVMQEHGSQIFSFALSFSVVASFWVIHHRIFEHVARYTPALMAFSLFWMFTVVFLQFPTAMVGALSSDSVLLALYIGLMTLSSLALSAMTWLVYRNPDIRASRPNFEPSSLASSFSSSVIFILVLLLAVVVPQWSYYTLFLLFLRLPMQRFIRPYFARSQNASR